MYRQCSCLYRYSAYIFNIGTYSDPYTSIGATLIITHNLQMYMYTQWCENSQSYRTLSDKSSECPVN